MKKVAWVTDIHLDFLENSEIEGFCAQISRFDPDLLLIGGDIGEAYSVFNYLQRLARSLKKPVYFVLGNHDYYHGSIVDVRFQAGEAARRIPNLIWLENAGVVGLTRSTALIGHGAWGDGRLGDYAHSIVELNDFRKIHELQDLTRAERLQILNRLGDESAEYLMACICDAFKQFSDLLLLTHVPPFEEACLYQGKIGGPDWLPYFTCDAVGRALKAVMQQNPDKQMRVLCGHSHHAASAQILPNLRVQTGGAEYGQPAIQDILTIV